METVIRPWRSADSASLAEALNNKKVLDNLRDGLPFPYTERDAAQYIEAMRSAPPGLCLRLRHRLRRPGRGQHLPHARREHPPP